MKCMLSQNRWQGEQPVEIELPDSWDTHVAEMHGDSLPVLTSEQLRERINAPVGSPRISEIAAGKKSAVIIFDDMSRGTPCVDAAHIVLEELAAAGIQKENIMFLCGMGLHGALERDDFVKKLGEDVVAEYLVYNHNPYENLVEIGTTTRGHKVLMNAEAVKYEVKIGIGGMVPHPTAGFSGGCKIVLPGIAGIDTVEVNHRVTRKFVWENNKGPFTDNLGNLRSKDLREDAEEAGMLFGLDFKIDIMMNTGCEIVDVSAGHPIAAFYDGVQRAFDVYKMGRFDKVDVCVINANSKPNEASMCYNIGAACIKEGGDIVIVNFAKTGIVNHYLSGMWGAETGGRLAPGSKHKTPLPPGIRQLILYNPYKQFNAIAQFGCPEQVKMAASWEEVLRLLPDRGEGTSAVVIKEGLMSIFADDFKKDYEPVNLGLTKKMD